MSHYFQSSEGEFRLLVRDLEINDDGTWTVEVANDLGKVTDTCKLTLKGEETRASAKKILKKQLLLAHF
jgi:hypothetical protein